MKRFSKSGVLSLALLVASALGLNASVAAHTDGSSWTAPAPAASTDGSTWT